LHDVVVVIESLKEIYLHSVDTFPITVICKILSCLCFIVCLLLTTINLLPVLTYRVRLFTFSLCPAGVLSLLLFFLFLFVTSDYYTNVIWASSFIWAAGFSGSLLPYLFGSIVFCYVLFIAWWQI